MSLLRRTFRRTPSATLVAEELAVVIEALDHSVSTLEAELVQTGITEIQIKRRRALAARLRLAL